MADDKITGSNTFYRQSPQAEATMAGDRAVIYHKGTGNAITLNRTGSILWRHLESPANCEQLLNALQENWPGLSRETAQRDVEVFLAELLSQGLCTRETETPAQ